MSDLTVTKKPGKPIRRWVRRGFLLWAVISTLWLVNSVRTQDVDEALLRSDAQISVVNGPATLEFWPLASNKTTALIFLCGSGVAAQAYAPLLRPVAEAGYPVLIIKLPYRFAPFETHKQTAITRTHTLIADHSQITNWVIAGHSLGAALACRAAQSNPKAFSALVLVGTTHPKQDDLSSLPMPVTKVYASNDGVAPRERILSNKNLLPKTTQWVEIKGGNHSQFGHYGHQLLDGKATISRDTQQTATRAAISEALTNAASRHGLLE